MQYEPERSEPNNTSSLADEIFIWDSTERLRIVGIVTENDTEDWYKVYQEDFAFTINSLELWVTQVFKYKVNIYDNNLNLRGSCICVGDPYPLIPDIILRQNEYLYIQVQFLEGDPIEPYGIYLNVESQY